MATTLKPGLTLDYQRNDVKSLENNLRELKESKELKFGFPNLFNQLKKLIINLILLILQKKPNNKEDITNIKLISSFNALDSTERSNSFIQSKMKEVKSIALEYLNQQKTNRDKLQKKLKINSNRVKDKNEAVLNLLGIFDEITEKNFSEHETKLQKSYSILKMQAWGGESKEEFQNRLIDSVVDARMNAKNISDLDSVKNNEILADIDDAYKYLREHAIPLPKVADACRNRDEEDETERYTSKNFTPSLR
ncbi:MAG: hypothetical protein E6K54_01270 [Gammaproteobacteria bacterium]|nr:MAG: hypothetical protein E6K54_01270 [Gammaproteobacteria bacterium]